MSDCRRRYVSLLVRGGFCLLLGNYKRNNESFKYNFEILIVGVRLEEGMVDVYNNINLVTILRLINIDPISLVSNRPLNDKNLFNCLVDLYRILSFATNDFLFYVIGAV